MPSDSRTVRDYVRGWVQYHSGPQADVEAIIEGDLTVDGVDLDTPLTDSLCLKLDARLGTKDRRDGAPTPMNVLESQLAERLPEECAREAAQVVSFALDPFLERWDITRRTPLPKGIAQELKSALKAELGPSSYRELEDLCT